MITLGVCSLVSLTVTIYKLLRLRQEHIVPKQLEKDVERIIVEESTEKMVLEEKDHWLAIQPSLLEGKSTLARLCAVVLIGRPGRNAHQVSNAVQSSAHEEILRMNSGLAALEVITTIAPLLGLLGTASGLVTVFGDIDSKETIQRGIATALSTTVVGIAIAVPSVIAHSYFSRRVETYAARLEVLVGRVVAAATERPF